MSAAIRVTEGEVESLFGEQRAKRRGDFNLMRSIVQQVSFRTGVLSMDLMGHTRKPRVVKARHLVMFKAYQNGLTYDFIGEYLGRHHTSVMHGVKKIKKKLSTP